MGDSDDEIYFGRVTAQELEVVKRRFLPGNDENRPSQSDPTCKKNVTLSNNPLETSNQDSFGNSGTECSQSTSKILDTSSNDGKFSVLASCYMKTPSNKPNLSKNINDSSISYSPLAVPLVIINDGTQQDNNATLETVATECEIINNELSVLNSIAGVTDDNFVRQNFSQKTFESVKLSDTVVPEITLHENKSFKSAFTETLLDVTASNRDSLEAHLSSIHKSIDTSASYVLKSDVSICSNSQTLSSGCISADSEVSTPKASVSFSHGLTPNVSIQNFLVSPDNCTSNIIKQLTFEDLVKCPGNEISVDSTNCTNHHSGSKMFNDIAVRLKNWNIISDDSEEVEIPQVRNLTTSISSSNTAECRSLSGTSDKTCTTNNNYTTDPDSDIGNLDQQTDVPSVSDICVRSSNSVTNDVNALQSRDDSQHGGCTFKQKLHQSSSDDVFFPGEMVGYREIDDENGSVLCSSLSDSSIDEDNKCNLNNTLEEMEMMFKYGVQYMLSTDDSVLSESTSNNLLKDCTHRPMSENLTRCRVLEPSQYVHAAHAEATSSVFQREIKEYNHTDSLFKTPTTSTFALKTGSSYSHRPQKQIKKRIHFSDIRSPVAAYIKDRPVQLLKTAVKVKSREQDNVLPRHRVQETVMQSNKQLGVNIIPALPEIRYERAPVFNVKQQPQLLERCVRLKKNYATPTVMRHAGRAVLATVPHNAVQLASSEVSVVFDKDVSRTTTL